MRLVAVAAALLGLGVAFLTFPSRDALVALLDGIVDPAAEPSTVATPAAPASAVQPAAATPAVTAPPTQPAATTPPADVPPTTQPPVPSTPSRAARSATSERSASAEGKTRRLATPLPPPDRPATARPQPARVGGNIPTPRKVKDVPPVYPPMAIQARVQGIVIIEATIGPDGVVDDAKVLRSVPLLDDAAVEAVRQWEYQPTFLNGVAVPVIMTVTVNFSLK